MKECFTRVHRCDVYVMVNKRSTVNIGFDIQGQKRVILDQFKHMTTSLLESWKTFLENLVSIDAITMIILRTLEIRPRKKIRAVTLYLREDRILISLRFYRHTITARDVLWKIW